jgi:uncharacterized membrane protein
MGGFFTDMEKFIEFLSRNSYGIIGAASGFILAVLFEAIGFYRTLFIIICTAAGYFIGSRYHSIFRI